MHLTQLWARRGVVLEAQGRWDEAVADYQTVLRAAPEDPSAWNNLGNANAGLGRCALVILPLLPDPCRPGILRQLTRPGATLGGNSTADVQPASLQPPAAQSLHEESWVPCGLCTLALTRARKACW